MTGLPRVTLLIWIFGPMSQVPAADWVVDQCRFTYKGHPVPLGRGLAEFTVLFGPPSDSIQAKFGSLKPFKTYFWDKIGLRTRMFSDEHPDWFGGVEISFRNPDTSGLRNQRRYPRGTSTVEVKPFGLLDAGTVATLNQEGFKPGHPRSQRADDYMELPLGHDSRLVMIVFNDDKAVPSILSLRYAAPDNTPYPDYAAAQGKMGSSCRLP